MSTHDEGWESRANRLGAENARLQARVQEVEALEEEWRSEAMMWEGRLTAAEALAERLREAATRVVEGDHLSRELGACDVHSEPDVCWWYERISNLRAAIAATPDEREKEKR